MHHHDAGCFVHTFPLFHFMRWYAYHACLCHPMAFYAFLHSCLHVHAWVLLTSVSSMLQQWSYGHSIQTYICPSRTPPFVCFFACLPSCLFVCFLVSFPSIAHLLVSCLCLCMYTYGARKYGARARSPRRKQKGRGCEHKDISQAVMFSRFRGLASPIWLCTLLNPLSSYLLSLLGGLC